MTPLKACGWILLREGRVLLLHNTRRREWGLPKGHAEPGETESETALRELEEETGLKVNQLDPDPSFRVEERYSVWTQAGARQEKICVYFRARSLTPTVRLSPEHDDHVWATSADVARLVTHPSLRRRLQEACA